MIRRFAAVLACLALFSALVLPAAAPAEKEPKTIRVGWYETPFNFKDAFGRRTGYAYEYQRKIAAYTGWKFEYVEGSWPELLEMMAEGRIDLLSDVSFTEERKEQMLFANLPMGTESYFVYVSAENSGISIQDTGTLEGKKVGVTRSTIQTGLFRGWLQEQGIAADTVELDCTEGESLAMVRRGDLDAFVTLDSYAGEEGVVPLWKIGGSDFFFVVNRNRPDLLGELNEAQSRIRDEDPFYSMELSERFLYNSGNSRHLTAEEKAWLEAHGPIRVGYQDNYLAFCAADPKTGELTGALKDYLETAAGAPENAAPVFETVAYPTAQEAMEALKNGEIDCMFPANLTAYDGEQAGVVMTAPLMRTEMDAVVRAGEKQDFLRHNQVRVGVNRGNPNYEMFLLEHFPSWTPVYYPDTPTCLDAVASGAADCIIISNYRYGDIARRCSRLNLTTVYTGVDMDYCFAVKEGNTTLYSILSRLIRLVPDSTVNAALTYYSAEGQEPGFLDRIRNDPAVMLPGGAALVLLAAVIVMAVKQKKKKRPAGKAPGA